MASLSDISRIAKKSSSLQVAALGRPPLLDKAAFARFPEMVKELERYNEAVLRYDERIKNILAEALLAARDVS